MAAQELDKPPPLPQYSEMIFAAIDGLNDKDGSSKSEISSYIESTYVDLPTEDSSVLSLHLNKMKESGDIIMVNNNYLRPNPDIAPPKRGRGRPPKLNSNPNPNPKPKLPLAADENVLSSPRPRGRPPKPKDPSAVDSPPKVSSGTEKARGRGRPPKKARTSGAVASTTTTTGPARPRGRPPKIKNTVAAVGSD
ncbi:hypothetical protein HHK36_014839 [Tetracentron sinense]|uniref:H15 domain-containing protein n=1 Tax=Tetracentron sinense TaxID=13715 RepID=A0A835DG70_TETSI|nr:hypothetical protein HHK36_014839 [Tetracentron sinense]